MSVAELIILYDFQLKVPTKQVAFKLCLCFNIMIDGTIKHVAQNINRLCIMVVAFNPSLKVTL